MNLPSVWTNDKQDIVIACSAPNASYWRVFIGTHSQCAAFCTEAA
jgi:hypothetical protein